jgi:hypothetical protein
LFLSHYPRDTQEPAGGRIIISLRPNGTERQNFTIPAIGRNITLGNEIASAASLVKPTPSRRATSNEEALGPELDDFANWHSGRAHGEREVHPLLGNERNMLPQSAPGAHLMIVNRDLVLAPYQS